MKSTAAQKNEGYVNSSDAFSAYSLEHDVELSCVRCEETVILDVDLNTNYRWFNLHGTDFCGPRGRLSHIVDGT